MATKHLIMRSGIAVLLVGVMLFQVSPVSAQLYNPELDLPKPTGVEKSLTKLGRGVSNVLFGWAEIPVTFDKKYKEGKPLAYLLGVVPVLGGARAVMRTSTGVFEMVSFPFTDKAVNYDAVLEPEYIF
ncbi:MAG: exosortase system-associated protein, TIGR04073 family [Candidatus Hydrogenedentes bacterium]|nr:exosortase system-associated protein, TIGR04073 family [Candidatus Hydrogenedentota bacterium]